MRQRADELWQKAQMQGCSEAGEKWSNVIHDLWCGRNRYFMPRLGEITEERALRLKAIFYERLAIKPGHLITTSAKYPTWEDIRAEFAKRYLQREEMRYGEPFDALGMPAWQRPYSLSSRSRQLFDESWDFAFANRIVTA